MSSRLSAPKSHLYWVFPAILLIGALDVLFSHRNLALTFFNLESLAESTRLPALVWLQRGISVLLVLLCAQQVLKQVGSHRRTPSAALLGAFILYWTCTIAIPAVFGTVPKLSHEYLYSLAMGVAMCLVQPEDHVRILRAARETLFVMMLAGVLLIPINTPMVLDMSYSQGLIPGLPRFGGLAPHPVSQGMLAQLALVLLWCMPYQRRWLNRLAWVLGLGVLFAAQSKTAWLAFLCCATVLFIVRRGGQFVQRVGDPRGGGFGVLMCLAVMAMVVVAAGWILFGNAAGKLEDFANSSEGAQLMTLTGRDRIWEAAIAEWHNNPMFGYGQTIWDAAYRAAIGLPNATHGHNQFMDDLARAGTVGVTALVIYAVTLLVLALRGARASGGLSIALFVAIALRSISEVPLMLLGYGPELFTQLLLLATLAAACTQRQPQSRPAQTMRYGVAS